MDMIGQRLYTGRTGWDIAPSFPTWHPRHPLHVIAMSTLVFARTLYKSAREYADNK
ncbi:ACOXL, partial [Symbiodinium sp. CCMP2592]